MNRHLNNMVQDFINTHVNIGRMNAICEDKEYEGKKIVTNFVYPPIPVRNMDWNAVLDDYDGAEDSNCPIGHGATEKEAIEDLIIEIESMK